MPPQGKERPGRRRISLMLLDQCPMTGPAVLARIRELPSYRVLAESADVDAMVSRVRDIRPDILLLNLGVGNACLALAGGVHGGIPATRVIIMGIGADHEDIASLVRARAAGLVMADESFEQVLQTIHLVSRGVWVLPASLTSPLFRQLNPHGTRRRPRRALDLRRLARVERQVATLVVRGLSNRAIAARLELGLRTVKRNVHLVLSRMTPGSKIEMGSFFLERPVPAIDRPPTPDPLALRNSPTGLILSN